MTDHRPGNPLRDLPLPALYFVIAGLWIAIQLIIRSRSITVISVSTTVIGGLLFSAVLTALIAANRRRLGGTHQVSGFRSALRTGVVPADADIARWRIELDRLDRSRTRTALLGVGASVLPFGLGVWGTTDPDARLVGIALIALVLAADATLLLALPSQRRRADRLRQELDRTEVARSD